MEKFWIKEDNKWVKQSERTEYQHYPDYSVENLMKLSYTHTPEILYHLNYRYKNDFIYTNAGKILIAINPFKPTELYSKQIQNEYLNNRDIGKPHIYQTINDAIVSDECKQSFLISGESGSGKTETTKRILEYLVQVYKDKNNVLPKILQFNNLLEAFGNAGTIRNHNSSRFGKYININIHNNVISARLQTYLLEKVRLVSDVTNYHIFYSFGYKKKSVKYHREDWNTDYLLKSNLQKVWVENNLPQSLWNNLEEIINYLIRILNEEYDECIQQLMREKTIRTCGEIINVKLEKKEGQNVRDTVVMAIYEKLFNKVVELINKQICGIENGDMNYGILDIFGFEVFDENGFEQLCINYTNEKLQSLFNKFVFEEEIRMFEEEGILKNRVSFENNKHIVDFFDSRPSGFFLLLDEKSIVGAKDEDLKLSLYDNKRVIHKRRDSFVINHYADKVEYNWGDFSQKNIEKYNQDIQKFLQDFYKSYEIFTEPEKKIIKKKRGSITTTTITSKFRNDLSKLIDELSNSHLHFIRCIKPNNENEAEKWDEQKVEAQLNYCGITSALELARQTFPIRMKKSIFKRKYECVLNNECTIEELDGDNFLNGKTMVFYTNDMQQFLNEKLIEIQKTLIEKLVYIIKMQKYYQQYKDILTKIIQIQNNCRNILCKRELFRRKSILLIQKNWRSKNRKDIFNRRLNATKKIQNFIKQKYQESNAKIIIERFVKMKSERQKCISFIIEERNNIENIIKQTIENEKIKLELHYEKQIKNLQETIHQQEIQIYRLQEKEKDYNHILNTINLNKSIDDTSSTISSDNEEILVDKSVEVNMDEIISSYEDKVNNEKKKYLDIQALYDNTQIKFHNYKTQNKEAQLLLGEKMLRLYNENMTVKEENMSLLREVKKLQQQKWYEKLIG